MDDLQHFIGGAWTPSTSDERLRAVDPTSGEVVATFPIGSEADVDLAVAAARAAQPAWAALTMTERIAHLERFIDAVAERVDSMAEWERREMGKPVAIGAQFIAGSIAGFRAALVAAADYPLEENISSPAGTTVIRREARGVIAEVTPWNFTVAQILGGLAPLLVAGNTVIVKPSEKSTPSAVDLFLANNLPAGVLNLLLGDGRVGGPLTAHAGIDGVLFTGSVATGRKVATAAGANLNPVTLELGGKDAAVVDAGVDIVQVAQDVALGAFLNTGQICASIERLYVHDEIADDFLEAFLAASDAFAPGGAMEMGPMIDDEQRGIVHSHVQDAVSRGARIVRGGELPDGPGTFYPVTVVEDVTRDMLLESSETFGPVVALTRVASFEEGLRRAADSDYGLAATVYSRDDAHIRAAHALPVGYVWINGWQGSAGIRLAEPHGVSGMGVSGNTRSFDNSTRVRTVFIPASTPRA
ncbi:aldehyde dehydrogenase family protein [Microbacterium sp. NPDC055357]